MKFGKGWVAPFGSTFWHRPFWSLLVPFGRLFLDGAECWASPSGFRWVVTVAGMVDCIWGWASARRGELASDPLN